MNGYLIFGDAYTPNDAVCRRLWTSDIDHESVRFKVRFVALIYRVMCLCSVGKCPRDQVIERSS